MVALDSLTRACGVNRKGWIKHMLRKYLVFMFITVLLVGCGFTSSSPTAVPVSNTLTPTVTPTPVPGYIAKIRNAEYQLGAADFPKMVQLVEGKYQQGSPGDTNYVSVVVMDYITQGVYDDQGSEGYAALVVENYGGSGSFIFLALYVDENGTPKFKTSILVEDRAQINELKMQDHAIYLDAVIHGSQDPMCCPTQRTTRHYRLDPNSGQLVMTDYVTFTPEGKPRTITIEAPANRDEVYSSVQFRGSVSIAPFENNLTYRIYSTGNVVLAEGSIQVSADQPGGPGTFNSVIVLGNILSGATIRVEIEDINAQDGSLFSMNSVDLVVQ